MWTKHAQRIGEGPAGAKGEKETEGEGRGELLQRCSARR